MKKFIALFFVIFIIMGLSSCKSEDSLEDKKDETEENRPNNENKPSSVKGIVVYFSATNHTKRVSNIIAGYLDIPTFELVPVTPYSSSDLNYSDPNSRVSKEHNDPNRHIELTSTTLPDFDSYDFIFIGYPIWWGEASWVVDDFVQKNNFEGKTIIPFAISASSPLGTSAKNLAAKASNGTWLDGIRFSSSASESTITEWIDQLNLS